MWKGRVYIEDILPLHYVKTMGVGQDKRSKSFSLDRIEILMQQIREVIQSLQQIVLVLNQVIAGSIFLQREMDLSRPVIY